MVLLSGSIAIGRVLRRLGLCIRFELATAIDPFNRKNKAAKGAFASNSNFADSR